MLKALLVDDEIAALRTLELLLSQFCKDIEVVGTASSSEEAVQKVTQSKPDLVFLDIEMPKGTGFDFIEKCPVRDFDIIFVTAYDNYALKAFRYSAIDYLLKPIDIDELVKAVEKVSKLRKAKIDTRNKYNALLENLKTIIPNKMVVRVEKGFEYIDISSITYFEFQNNALKVHFTNGKEMQLIESLEDIQDELDEKNFFRIHPNYFVNINSIKRIPKMGVNNIEMANGILLPIIPDVKDSLIRCLTDLNKQIPT